MTESTVETRNTRIPITAYRGRFRIRKKSHAKKINPGQIGWLHSYAFIRQIPILAMLNLLNFHLMIRLIVHFFPFSVVTPNIASNFCEEIGWRQICQYSKPLVCSTLPDNPISPIYNPAAFFNSWYRLSSMSMKPSFSQA